MKKLFLPISIITLVLIMAGILIYQRPETEITSIGRYSEFIHVGILILFFGLGLYFGIKRIISFKEGFPEEDELSKRIVQKAAAVSFYLSLFLWLVLLSIQNSKIIDNSVLYGYGFIGMALIFLLSWSVLNVRGIKDE